MTPMSKKGDRSQRPEEILRDASARLKRQSPGMSLRAVAGRLNVTPSYWSKVLNGKKPITDTLLPQIIKVLRLDSQQIAHLQRAILEAIDTNQLAPVTGMRTIEKDERSPIEDYKDINRSDLWIFSDWYYSPILNVITLTNLEPTSVAIAQFLGLPLSEVERAISRLESAGFVKGDESGHYSRTSLKIRFPADRSFKEMRQFHRLMLQRAQAELARTDVDSSFQKRLISSVCFSGPSKKLAEARLLIEEAMFKVANLMADEPQSDEVYHLGVQLFPLGKSLQK